MLRTVLLLCTWGLLWSGPAPAQPPVPDRLPQRLLFLGEPDTPRAKDFEAFLAKRFTSVRVADRWQWDRALLAAADVVVVDWPQRDGVSKWMLDGDKTVAPRSPLGARADWTRPTLLLGSAGLNVSWAWDVKGGYG